MLKKHDIKRNVVFFYKHLKLIQILKKIAKMNSILRTHIIITIIIVVRGRVVL